MKKSKTDQWLNQLKWLENAYNENQGKHHIQIDSISQIQDKIEQVISINLKEKMNAWEDEMRKNISE